MTDTLTLGGEPCRLIPGYEDYAVSASGRVWSLKFGKVRELKQGKHNAGYWLVVLSENKEKRGFAVHYLVMLAWVGDCPEGYEVNHKNRNRGDNYLDNLEYVTHAENMAYSRELGAWDGLIGERAANAKLTEQDVKDIRAMYAAGGWTYKSLAEVFSTPDKTLSLEAIFAIVSRRTWKHLP
jgi:hypothetical protein